MTLSWITASDLTKTKEFFTDTLGLKKTTDVAEYGWCEFLGQEGGMYLGVGQSRGAEDLVKPGQNAVVTMVVDDIMQAKTELESKGVRFLDEIIEVPGHVKMVTFQDFDGNKFQLVEELS